MEATHKRLNTSTASAGSPFGVTRPLKTLPKVSVPSRSGKRDNQKTSYGTSHNSSQKFTLGTSKQNNYQKMETGKSVPGSSYSSGSPGKQKSSMSFGIIWLPTRKNKHKKEKIYKSYTDDYQSKNPHNYFMADERENLSKGYEGHIENTASTLPLVGSSSSAVAAIGSNPFESTNSDANDDQSEKEGLVSHHDGSDDEKSYDKNESDTSKSYDNDDDMDPKSPRKKEGQSGDRTDKMDGVYVNKSSSGKTRSNPETENNHDDKCDKCIIDCLYFSMQCFHCSIS